MTEPGIGPIRDFQLDRFQREAIEVLGRGVSVLVAAPTGSGKTVVAEEAVSLALQAGRRVFYTTPIKALSNQKFADLSRLHGADQVGLLTGDNTINGDAPVVVMTTEVLRNMIYAGNALQDLAYVVLDEVHYLQDAYRGPVWEEVIIHLPTHVRLVCLSATVSNADELVDWISLVRDRAEAVVETQRPIHLEHLFMATDRTSQHLQLLPVLVDGHANPEGARFDVTVTGRGPRGRPRTRFAAPRRPEVVQELADRDLLPVLYFVFSRAGCDEAASTCLNAGLRLTTVDERARIRTILAEHVAGLAPADLDVLGFDRFAAALEAGIASHHAGMVPPFKEAVERCFVAGLVKAVFATETLALGINMPARTVVIEKLTKFTGERHEFLTAGEYTQLTGRAGRRGIDDIGRAVVLWSPFVSFEAVAALAASRSFFLRSAFRPTYNMAANLVRRYQQTDAYRLLNRSFAQYQADRSVVQLERRRDERRQDIERLQATVEVDPASLGEYLTLRRAARDAGTPDAAAQGAIELAASRLQPGTIIQYSGEAVVVLSVAQRRAGTLVRIITASRRVLSLQATDFLDPPQRLGSVDLPQPFRPHHQGFQQEVVRRLTRARVQVRRPGKRRGSDDPPSGGSGAVDGGATLAVDPGPGAEAVRDRWEAVRDHPLHHHPDREALLRLAQRLSRLHGELSELTGRIEGSADTVAVRFGRLLELLRRWGYVDGWSLTEKGLVLARCYHESDLLVVQCLAEGLLDGVDGPTVAALVSCFTYEHRSRTVAPSAWLPSATARERYRSMVRIADRLNAAEEDAGLLITRTPDATFAPIAHAWASGGDLDVVLGDEELSGGDFVRNVKQLIDLLRQIGEFAPVPATAAAARQAAEALYRGVVSASSGIDEAGGARPVGGPGSAESSSSSSLSSTASSAVSSSVASRSPWAEGGRGDGAGESGGGPASDGGGPASDGGGRDGGGGARPGDRTPKGTRPSAAGSGGGKAGPPPRKSGAGPRQGGRKRPR
ncbi:MAG: DEAD/DEAH box helicase [Acidimicrobiales bacterium]